MQDLVAMFTDAGCRDVRTYIQSGNVVFAADPVLAGRVPEIIAKAIARSLDLGVPVVTRTGREIVDAARGNPFANTAADPKALHVAFLASTPNADRLAALDPDRSPPDQFVVRGRDVYLLCPNGVARTKLTNAYFDGKLKTTSTLRNWRTVLSLADMVCEGQ